MIYGAHNVNGKRPVAVSVTRPSDRPVRMSAGGDCRRVDLRVCQCYVECFTNCQLPIITAIFEDKKMHADTVIEKEAKRETLELSNNVVHCAAKEYTLFIVHHLPES